jgi:hypothetical protein
MGSAKSPQNQRSILTLVTLSQSLTFRPAQTMPLWVPWPDIVWCRALKVHIRGVRTIVLLMWMPLPDTPMRVLRLVIALATVASAVATQLRGLGGAGGPPEEGAVRDFEQAGGVPDNNSQETMEHNAALLTMLLSSLNAGDIFVLPNKTYWVNGGVVVHSLQDVTIRIDGTLKFSDDRKHWPKDASGAVMECLLFENFTNVVFTSSGTGTLDGNGKEWWGALTFLVHKEDRPRLMHLVRARNVVVENLMFKNSPYWSFWAEGSDGLIIRHSAVDARWTDKPGHSYLDLQVRGGCWGGEGPRL